VAEGGPLGGTVAGRVSHANQGPVWLPTRSAGLATAALSEAIISGPARWMGVTGSKRLRIAEDFARWARTELGPRLVRVVLFGSVARGEEREESDIDILLEIKGNPVPVRRLLGGRIMEIAANEGVFVSAFVQSVEPRAGNRHFGIYKVIEKEGRVLA